MLQLNHDLCEKDMQGGEHLECRVWLDMGQKETGKRLFIWLQFVLIPRKPPQVGRGKKLGKLAAYSSVPLHFVLNRLEVLNHLVLLRWRGDGPASEGQEVTAGHSAAPTSADSIWLSSAWTSKDSEGKKMIQLILDCSLLTSEAKWCRVTLSFGLVVRAGWRS